MATGATRPTCQRARRKTATRRAPAKLVTRAAASAAATATARRARPASTRARVRSCRPRRERARCRLRHRGNPRASPHHDSDFEALKPLMPLSTKSHLCVSYFARRSSHAAPGAARVASARVPPDLRVRRSLALPQHSNRDDGLHVHLGWLRDPGGPHVQGRVHLGGTCATACLGFFFAHPIRRARRARPTAQSYEAHRHLRSRASLFFRSAVLTSCASCDHGKNASSRRTRRMRSSATTANTRRTGSSRRNRGASCTARFRCSCLTKTTDCCYSNERVRRSRSRLCGRTRAVRIRCTGTSRARWTRIWT